MVFTPVDVRALVGDLPFSQTELFYLRRGTVGPEGEAKIEVRSGKLFVIE